MTEDTLLKIANTFYYIVSPLSGSLAGAAVGMFMGGIMAPGLLYAGAFGGAICGFLIGCLFNKLAYEPETSLPRERK